MPNVLQIFNSINRLFKDMGDGTYTPVISLDSSASNPIRTSDTKAGTRTYNWLTDVRTNVTLTLSPAIEIPALYDSRELMIYSSERCFVRFGNSSVSPATSGGNQLILEAGERFHLRIPETELYIRVIRDTTDGFISLTAVVS